MDIKLVAAQFGLAAGEVKRVESAALSQVYLVDDKYVLRSRTADADAAARLQNEQNLLAAIRKMVPLRFPSLITLPSGQDYVLADGLLWTAYPLIPGRILCGWQALENLSETEARSVFTSLREMHDATAGRLSGLDISSGYDLIADVSRCLADSGDAISAKEKNRLQAALAHVISQREHLEEKDFCFVHGDYHPGNIIFQDGRIVALLDTDWARKGHYFEDLAYTLMMFLRDYRQSRFQFKSAEYEKFLSWYGVEEKDQPALIDYLLLYAFYDFQLFQGLTQLPRRDQILSYQAELLADFCARF